MIIYFHYARGKYALFVFVDVLKAHNVWVVNPLLLRLLIPNSTSDLVADCESALLHVYVSCSWVCTVAAFGYTGLCVGLLFLCLTHQSCWLFHREADRVGNKSQVVLIRVKQRRPGL